MKTAALIVAAGRGTRVGVRAGGPKQYADVGGQSLLWYSVRSFLNHPGIDVVRVVIHRDDEAAYAVVADEFDGRLGDRIFGGSTRQASVLCGLEALEGEGVAQVLIHDAARPFMPSGIIDGVLTGLEAHDGAIASVAVSDTLKRAGDDGLIANTVSRKELWRAQTPQAFNYELILAAHRRAAGEELMDFTDDASIAEWSGMNVCLTAGSILNDKITTAEDLEMARTRMGAGVSEFETRSGTGFDVHRFEEGSEVWLCGVSIPFEKGLKGHSDADVGLHALTDAILGAIGDGDIGAHFPPSDPQWKGASSDQFLADAGQRVRGRGGKIVNVDVTLLCEAPKIGPHREAMRQVISSILEIDVERVGVKATTTEGLGFTGRREGIAAMASASVGLPARR